ncbi:MAG TPA: UpxY family transcription antiterminator [Puia sp.]|jgi:transcription antitermination factor NusG|nr:UpxY family transcription antiterminator [Puia sp.]
MPVEKRHWYAVYTRPRWEKKVYSLLCEKGIEAYCPLNRVRKKWSDRIKWVEEPLFKSYVFVKVGENETMRVRTISGIVNFVYWLGKPAIVKNKEIEVIRKFLNEHDEVEAVPVDLKAESRITIRQGAFMDKKGKVVKVFNNKVRVVIESIGYSLVATVDRANVSLAENW